MLDNGNVVRITVERGPSIETICICQINREPVLVARIHHIDQQRGHPVVVKFLKPRLQNSLIYDVTHETFP